MSLDLLRAERARRGLPDYARPEPKPVPVQPARPEPVEWWTCARCEEDFTPDSFNAGGTVNEGSAWRICNDCFNREWPKRWVTCTGCNEPMETRGRGDAPKCRGCRPSREERRAQMLADYRRLSAEHGCRPGGSGITGPEFSARVPYTCDAVRRYFGSWRAFVEAAGYRTRALAAASERGAA